ncbi:Uncharacterized protein ESCO_003394 [Escovopsis weberi]|uniref:MINDY deubiquitinase domain-containing protein n=1 Tax=Escovopsis weberi TaxID=150374 RepID=A0A0M9VXK7_ESCWE|nr:Uncharacterized protein ESCO_003394 [Escovopsis weberi]
MGTDPWAPSTPDPSAKEPQAPTSPALLSFQSDGSGWEDASDDDDKHGDEHGDEPGDEKSGYDASGGNGTNVRSPVMNEELARDQHVWDDSPADISGTSLVSVLCSREQVSLNLLLEAVFEELMSPRRTRSDKALPDVTDLYAFLQSLHTGMNVNPRFIPTPEMVEAFKRTSLTHIDPDERGKFIPGTFENTLEMSLYAAFSIPLIHGWLPPMDDPAYGAMHRHATSYEDTQNLLFREEELERKLSTDSGLTEGEQGLYNDIVTIRMFLDSSATQLTPWGIDVIGKVMRPGTFAILFRNDHFSTLYCHPETLQLFTLVTDAGYESHSDIVWESLLDVNGTKLQ